MYMISLLGMGVAFLYCDKESPSIEGLLMCQGATSVIDR